MNEKDYGILGKMRKGQQYAASVSAKFVSSREEGERTRTEVTLTLVPYHYYTFSHGTRDNSPNSLGLERLQFKAAPAERNKHGTVYTRKTVQ